MGPGLRLGTTVFIGAIAIVCAAPARAQVAAPSAPLPWTAGMPDRIAPGPLHIIVSLRSQRLTLYSNGKLVARVPVSTGTRDHPTPTGIFSVLQKRRRHESNIYSGAPMYSMQRITWSGVALHEGQLPGHAASHGCVRLPRDFAVPLFGLTDIGATVVIAQDEPVVEPFPLLTDLFSRTELDHPDNAGPPPPPPPPLEPRLATIRAYDRAHPLPNPFASREADAGDPQHAQRIDNIAVLISRKERRVFVRRHFEPWLEASVEIAEPQRPLGTYLFTAMDFQGQNGGMQWSLVALNGPEPHAASRAKAALRRIVLPSDIAQKITDALTPGAKVIITDEAPSAETRDHTEFVVLTPTARPLRMAAPAVRAPIARTLPSARGPALSATRPAPASAASLRAPWPFLTRR